MRAAHRIDEGRVAFERYHDVVGDGVPFPMASEPEHTAAEAPVAWPARNDHAVELMFAHLGAQRRITAGVFGGRELLVYGVLIVGRAAHHVERQVLVEAMA